MSYKIVIYAEKFQNLPSEKAQVLTLASLFFSKNIKIQLDKINNVEYMSNDGSLPVFSIDSKLYSGIENAKVIIENLLNQSNNLNDLSIQGKSLTDRIQFHNEIVQFNYAKCFLENLFLYEEWISENGVQLTTSAYTVRYSWPLNKILWMKRERAVRNFMQYSHYNTSKQELLNEFDTFCLFLSNNIENNFLFNKSHPTELDLLVFGFFTIMQRYPVYFGNYLETTSRYPKIKQLFVRITELSGDILEFWEEHLFDL